MNDTLISIEELSDSKELLLMRPNRLLAIFTIIIALMLAAAVIWMSIGKIDIYATAIGLVRTDDKPSGLRVINGGKASSVNMVDGQDVTKGDILLSFDYQAITAQQYNNIRDINALESEIDLLRLYRNSIDELINYLEDSVTDMGRAYSLKVESFLLQRETALTQIAEEDQNNEVRRASAELKLKNARDTLSQLQSERHWAQLYKASLENNLDMISTADGNNPYKSNYLSMYQKYTANLDSLEIDKSQAQTNLDQTSSLFEIGSVSRMDLDNAQNALNDAENRIKAFRQQELSAINAKLADMEININNAKGVINTAEQEADLYSVAKTSQFMQVDQARISLLTQIDSEIQQKTESIDSLYANNETLSAQIGDTELTAPIDGVLNLFHEINEGDIVPPGTEIGEITPPGSDSFRVVLQVNNKDIAGIKTEQPVKFKFLALPYQEYGMVDGYISKISADSRINTQTGQSFYTVEAVIENKPIKSYKGADESIKVGMAVEGRIIKEQKTILRWLLEKMNFLD